MRAFLEAAVWRQLAVFLVALAIPVVVYAECEAANEPPYYPPAPQVAVVDGYVEGTHIIVSGTGLTAGSHSVMAQAGYSGSPQRVGPVQGVAVPDSAGNLFPEDITLPLGKALFGGLLLWLVNDATGVVSDVATIALQEASSKPNCVPPYRGGLYKELPSRVGCQKHHMPSVAAWKRVNASPAATSYSYRCTPVIEMLHPPDHAKAATTYNKAGAAEFVDDEVAAILGPFGLQRGFADAFELGANDVKRINDGAAATTYGGAIIEARNAMNARVPPGGIKC